MSQERLKILEMLQEGKITAQEAAQLLSSVDNTPKPSGDVYKGYSNSQNQQNQIPLPPPPPMPTSAPSSSSSVDFNALANDLGRKFEVFAKNLEPKIQRFSEVVAEKAVQVSDMISRSISEPAKPSTPPPSSSISAPSMPAPAIGLESKTFETIIDSKHGDLNLFGFNGDVFVKGYNGDKMTIKVLYKTKVKGTEIELMKLGSKYYLNYDEEYFEKVYIDALIPEGLFNNLRLQTINGKIEASNINSSYFSVTNQNGDVIIKSVDSQNMKIDGQNGKLMIENLTGDNGHIENSGGGIKARGIDVANLKLSSFNASVIMEIPYFARACEYVWFVETSNNKININLPTDKKVGYYIKAQTSISNVQLGLSDLSFSKYEPTYVEATSGNFSTCAKKVKLSAETSNGPITIS